MNMMPTKTAAQREVDTPSSLLVTFGLDRPLAMDAGVSLSPFTIAYQTYGTLNAAKSNAILVCHALTGDQHVANANPLTGKPGWWTSLVGPGKPIDTDRYFVICSNVLGGCMGTTGPASVNPATGRPYALDLPVVTIRDMVRAQAMLIDHLGIDTLFCVVGGSMGGMQVAAMGGELSRSRVLRHAGGDGGAAFLAEHRLPRGRAPGGDGRSRLVQGALPRRGQISRQGPRRGAHGGPHHLPVGARRCSASSGASCRAARRRPSPSTADFQIENYLRYQGMSFVDRFDANSYLYVTRACDYFDLADDYGGQLAMAFKGSKTRFCVVSFSSDWLYPTSASRAIVHALNAGGASVSFVDIVTDRGHDAFLIDDPEFNATAHGFLEGAARARGLKPA